MRTLTTAAFGLLLILGLAACGGGTGAAGSAAGSLPAATDAGPCEVATAVGAVAATAVDFAFDPASISATAGQTVTWTNGDAAPHTVTLDDGTCDTGQFAQGQTGSITFNVAGTYAFHCEVHPSMTGTVEVSG